MATLKKLPFGEVTTMQHDQDYTGHLVRLNFSLALGNNFSYSQYVSEIMVNMQPDNAQELLVEYTRGLDLGDDLIIIDSNNNELNTCVSDFNDHTRDTWAQYCKDTY